MRTVLVLDDYHLVQKSRPINNAIEFMLERLAAYIHLVHHRPAWPGPASVDNSGKRATN